ncbi:MAG TPA: hypothetical protein DD827_11055 [Gammaproteobacteria bacterium]|jgi:transposase InsO family protein|nr:hypothetical protein [Gammaproteobacteria bacterium]
MTAWTLHMSIATLSDWNKLFDPDMVPYRKPEKRGKAGKVTIEIVRIIVAKARDIQGKGKKIRIKQFCRTIRDDLAIELGRKTVQEILVANDLYAPSTRTRRPLFYRNICRRIPNGLLSLDGSEFVVTIDDKPYKFNLEIGVDVGSFCHTGFDIRQTETSQAVIAVLEEHQKHYGLPLGVLFDHGSANMSEDVAKWLEDKGVERVPVGPGNPKGNGTSEGAFSQLKSVLGTIDVKTSSPEELGKSVLNILVSVYTKMRNKLSLRGSTYSPEVAMRTEISEQEYQHEKERIRIHKESEKTTDEDQQKLDSLYTVIKQHDLLLDDASMKRAESIIKSHSLTAIHKTERAFTLAVNRKQDRKNVSYFFGILGNIQQEEDNQIYKDYCREKYDYQRMLADELQEQKIQSLKPTIALVIDMALAVKGQSEKMQGFAIKKCGEWLNIIFGTTSYCAVVKKRIQGQIGKTTSLTVTQKEAVWEWIAPLLNVNAGCESVTSIS